MTQTEQTLNDIYQTVYGQTRENVLLNWARETIIGLQSQYQSVFFMEISTQRERRLRYLRGRLVIAISEYIEAYYQFLSVGSN